MGDCGSMRAIGVAVQAFLPLVGACGNGREAPLVTLRDSAGVTIAESSDPAWGAGDQWTLSAEAVLETGETEGADEYLLFHASCPLKLGDGRIVVVNGGTSEIRFYDSTGAFVRAVGGRGGGPGEFGSGPTIWRLGNDRLLAFDGMGQRVSIFDTVGAFERSFRLEWDASFRYTSMLEVAGPSTMDRCSYGRSPVCLCRRPVGGGECFRSSATVRTAT